MQRLRLLPTFRSARELAINEVFFRNNKEKNLILRRLREGYRSNWDEKLPPPWGNVKNFIPREALAKCRKRFESETKLGRMVGGLGWSKKHVREFLGRDFYVIPCGAVPKGYDPHGRIIHDFSFAPAGEKSINESLLDNSVKYITFLERVEALSIFFACRFIFYFGAPSFF